MNKYTFALLTTLTLSTSSFASQVLQNPIFCTTDGEPGPMNATVTVHQKADESYDFVLYGGPVRFEATEETVTFETFNDRYHRKLVLDGTRTKGIFHYNYGTSAKSPVVCKSFEGQRIVVAQGYDHPDGSLNVHDEAVQSCRGFAEPISEVTSSYHYHSGTTSYRQAFRCL